MAFVASREAPERPKVALCGRPESAIRAEQEFCSSEKIEMNIREAAAGGCVWGEQTGSVSKFRLD